MTLDVVAWHGEWWSLNNRHLKALKLYLREIHPEWKRADRKARVRIWRLQGGRTVTEKFASAFVVASAGEGILLTIDAIMGTIHTEVTIGPPDVHCVAFAPSGRAMATRMYTCQVDGVPQVSNWPTVGTWGWMVLKLSLWSPKMSTLISESDSAGSLHEGESNRR